MKEIDLDFDGNRSGSMLSIDKESLQHNLKFLKSKLEPNTLVMAMVKAFAYGHGAYNIALELEKTNAVNYFGVANIQKGIELRKYGVKLPIMVTNPMPNSFDIMCQFGLEPVLHNLELASDFASFLEKSNWIDSRYPVHIKFNTGMNRFGLDESEIISFQKIHAEADWKISSVMSHLSSTDIVGQDEFTMNQIYSFIRIKDRVKEFVKEGFLSHILNSNGVIRFPEFQFDMVRLGIGIYGATEFLPARKELKPISKFKTQIAQIRFVKKGESISYARSGKPNEDCYIATLAIGYADGIPRILGNGKWEVEINNTLYPTIGNICMDYTMINLGQQKPNFMQGSYVVLFGGLKSIYDFAASQNTICYEAMTNLGNRVQRVLFD